MAAKASKKDGTLKVGTVLTKAGKKVGTQAQGQKAGSKEEREKECRETASTVEKSDTQLDYAPIHPIHRKEKG